MLASVVSGSASRASGSGGAGGSHSLDFPCLPEVPDLPWLRFAKPAVPVSVSEDDTTFGNPAVLVPDSTGVVPGSVSEDDAIDDNPEADSTVASVVGIEPLCAESHEVTRADVSKLHQTPEDEALEGVSTVSSEVPIVLVPDGSAAETLEGVFAVTSEVPKVSVCNCSCESKSVFPVDAPAAKRLKVTPTQHDSIDATPCRGQPQLLPAPGPGPQSSPVGDSCTLTAATFPDALPLFLPDHNVRLTAAATHRNVRASRPSPHCPPPLAAPLAPLPKPMSTRRPATSWVALRRIVLYVLTFRMKTMTLLSPGGASITIPTHCRPSPCRPSSTSSLTSHPRASRFFAPCKQICHPSRPPSSCPWCDLVSIASHPVLPPPMSRPWVLDRR